MHVEKNAKIPYSVKPAYGEKARACNAFEFIPEACANCKCIHYYKCCYYYCQHHCIHSALTTNPSHSLNKVNRPLRLIH